METIKIGVIGLGYVGLPLTVEFGKKYPTIGFDVNQQRVRELKDHFDKTLEVTNEEISASQFLSFSNNRDDLYECTYFIITVPTPIDPYKNPDLSYIIKASETAASVLKKGDIVIYESTVYPGCTDEVCVPVLEKKSGLKFNRDFFCGYSPERINPGDKVHRLTSIKKITSGSTPETAEKVDHLYKSIITAGTHPVSSIMVAEAAKIIENTQRDINIAFINELSLIFEKMNIDTYEVLEAAATKWNFLSFKPGLVGGHCIGVDPYYLTHKAESMGYHPQVILAGRRINDNMGFHVAQNLIKMMIKKGLKIQGSTVLILGITFKENCPDIRNSRVIDIINELKDYECQVDVYDPWAITEEVKHEYHINLIPQITKVYNAIILAVSHDIFKDFPIAQHTDRNSCIYDLKALWDKSQTHKRL